MVGGSIVEDLETLPVRQAASKSVYLYDPSLGLDLRAEDNGVSSGSAIDLRATYGPEHRETEATLVNLGISLRRLGAYGEAEEVVRESLAIARVRVGDDGREVARALTTLSGVLRFQGRYDEAVSALEEAIAIYERVSGPESRNVAGAHSALGLVLQAKGDWDEAEPVMRRSLELIRASWGAEHVFVDMAMVNLGDLLVQLGKLDEARAMLLAATEGTREAFPATSPRVANALVALARCHLARDDAAAAEVAAAEAVSIRAGFDPPRPVRLATAEALLGTALVRLDRLDDAQQVLNAAAERIGPPVEAEPAATTESRAEVRRATEELEARRSPG